MNKGNKKHDEEKGVRSEESKTGCKIFQESIRNEDSKIEEVLSSKENVVYKKKEPPIPQKLKNFFLIY